MACYGNKERSFLKKDKQWKRLYRISYAIFLWMGQDMLLNKIWFEIDYKTKTVNYRSSVNKKRQFNIKFPALVCSIFLAKIQIELFFFCGQKDYCQNFCLLSQFLLTIFIFSWPTLEGERRSWNLCEVFFPTAAYPPWSANGASHCISSSKHRMGCLDSNSYTSVWHKSVLLFTSEFCKVSFFCGRTRKQPFLVWLKCPSCDCELCDSTERHWTDKSRPRGIDEQ